MNELTFKLIIFIALIISGVSFLIWHSLLSEGFAIMFGVWTIWNLIDFMFFRKNDSTPIGGLKK